MALDSGPTNSPTNWSKFELFLGLNRKALEQVILGAKTLLLRSCIEFYEQVAINSRWVGGAAMTTFALKKLCTPGSYVILLQKWS